MIANASRNSSTSSSRRRKIAVFAWRGPDYINDPETDAAGAASFGQKIREAVECLALPDVADADPLTVSVGVSSIDQVGCDARALVDDADTQLYRAKAAGRNLTFAA